MNLTCPACGSQASAEVWQNDEEAREAFTLLASLPAEVQAEALRYLALFRPAKSRLSWARAGRLLAELRDLVTSREVLRNRQSRPCPPAIWAAAMAQMQAQRDRIQRPLPNHNYLIAIAYDLAGQAGIQPIQVNRQTAPQSKTMGAVAALEEYARHG